MKINKGEADGRAVGLGQGLQKVMGGQKTSKHFLVFEITCNPSQILSVPLDQLYDVNAEMVCRTFFI